MNVGKLQRGSERVLTEKVFLDAIEDIGGESTLPEGAATEPRVFSPLVFLFFLSNILFCDNY